MPATSGGVEYRPPAPACAVHRSVDDNPARRPGLAAHWHQSTIQAIAGNPVYSGDAHAYSRRATKTRGKRREVLRPVEERVVVRDVAAVLVASDVAEAVQSRLAPNKTVATSNTCKPEAALLRRGCTRCGYCGRAMRVMNHTSGTICRCEAGNRDSFGGPHHGTTAVVFVRAVWRRAESILTRPEVSPGRGETTRPGPTGRRSTADSPRPSASGQTPFASRPGWTTTRPWPPS